jgi:uncharacterized protein with von Willebrand factor type A (vWA) domain
MAKKEPILRIVAESNAFSVDIFCVSEAECLKHLKKIKSWQKNTAETETEYNYYGRTNYGAVRKYRRKQTSENKLTIKILHL